LTADGGQIVVGRLTGDRARLSNVDGYLVLPHLGEEVSGGWHTETFQAIADVALEQFGGVSDEHHADVLSGFD
jgi:hypothetical protein